MDVQLQDKRALVIGSTRGLGRAITKTSATEGVIVVQAGENPTGGTLNCWNTSCFFNPTSI